MNRAQYAGLAITLASILCAPAARTANHREAPITALDRLADITDVFAFRSYDPAAPDSVTLILCVDPLLEPSNGPNYFPFDPEILYAIHVDNDHDAVEDLSFEIRFETDIRLPGVFTAYVGAGAGIDAPFNSPPPIAPGTPLIPPAVTALDGPGSEGLGVRQTYSVHLVKSDARSNKGKTKVKRRERIELGAELLKIAVPSNVGPRTMPDYPAFAELGTYDLGEGVRTFAGTVEDPFWIDLGAAFDTLNFRAMGFAIPGVLSDAQDADDASNYAADDVAGYNVNAIAIEVPIAMLTSTGEVEAADAPEATIGVWATTSRPARRVRSPRSAATATSKGFLQVQRMGNPLFNELIIGTGSKDLFSMSAPSDDAQFASFALDPFLARAINAAYAGAVPIPEPPRLDLLPLVQYLPPIAAPGTPAGPVADLLRLNTGVAPTAPADARRLGLLAHDAAGNPTPDAAAFPNGRRLFDDVVDVAARVVVGVLTGDPAFAGFPNNRIGDGVNSNDVAYRDTFPYLGFAHSGRDSRHVDPDESGCGGVCPVD